MSYPKHPDTIVLKNQFYPKGITELDIWNYYQSVKDNILPEIVNNDLMFLIFADLNKPIIRRAGKETRFIRITKSNYDEVIHGKLVVIYSTMKRTEDFGIIDVDCDDFDKNKQATRDCFDFLQNISFIKKSWIKYTGKQGFHIICEFGKKMNIDSIRSVLEKVLKQSSLTDKYTVQYARSKGIPNFDLGPNKFRGPYITLYSLSAWGLRCIKVDYKKLMSFRRESVKIK